MSSLPDRRNSPRRRNIDRGSSDLPLRVAVLMYVNLPLIVFMANGSWQALVLILGMLRWALRPLKNGVQL